MELGFLIIILVVKNHYPRILNNHTFRYIHCKSMANKWDFFFIFYFFLFVFHLPIKLYIFIYWLKYFLVINYNLFLDYFYFSHFNFLYLVFQLLMENLQYLIGYILQGGRKGIGGKRSLGIRWGSFKNYR